jgi:uncharacterized protein (TIGR02757 family)
VQIRKSVQDFLGRILRSRSGSVQNWFLKLGTPSGLEEAKKDLSGFKHRFHSAEDLLLLAQLVARSWRTHGSLGAHFLSHHAATASDITGALNRWLEDWRVWGKELNPTVAQSRSFGHFLSAPSGGSCCKRWCMFLRWMGRKDELDPGLWTAGSPLLQSPSSLTPLRPDQLIIPLDTHTGRIAKYLGLTRRKNLGWAAALEVTQALRACDVSDPVRYDFALARMGILDLCQKQFRVEICQQCQLLPVCIFAKSEMSRKSRSKILAQPKPRRP